MKLLVFGACYHTPEFFSNCYRFITESAKKHNIDFQIYGMGATYYPGWIEIKLRGKLRYLESVRDQFDHVLYTDASDAFFLAPLSEIIEKYERCGSPQMLVSAGEYKQGGMEDIDKPGSFMHNGGYIAKMDYLIDTLKSFLEISDGYGDDSHIWYRANQEGWFTPTIDLNREIFQVYQTQFPNSHKLQVIDGRLHNLTTKTRPCIVHFADGFTDPVIGKNNIIEPWYKQVYG